MCSSDLVERYNYGSEIDKKEFYGIQIDRSSHKFSFCRVSILDAVFIWNILRNNGYIEGPMVCMGTRNSREVDLFRIAKNSRILKKIVHLLEIRKNGFSSMLPVVERVGRSDINNIGSESIIGVEINPLVRRRDILIASFDELPSHYENRFSVLYSNSFDQSLNPHETAEEWLRVVKDGAFIVLHFKENDRVTYTDPTGGLNINNLGRLFPGTVVHHSKSNMDTCNPDCLIMQIRKPKLGGLR